MPIEIRGQSDADIVQVANAFEAYGDEHPDAQIVIYRQGSVSIRVRIVDAAFSKMSRADRHEALWRYLETLPESVQSQVSLLLALAPEETSESFANLEFDNPIPSAL